jgi:hypothetical protein
VILYDDEHLLINEREMVLNDGVLLMDKIQNVDRALKNLFDLFDLMFVVVLTEYLNDNHYRYKKKEDLLLFD